MPPTMKNTEKFRVKTFPSEEAFKEALRKVGV